MSFNDWLLSSLIHRSFLITTNVKNIKLQRHHCHYHLHDTAMTSAIDHLLHIHGQYQSYQKQNCSNLFAFVPSIPMNNHHVPLKFKENVHQNPMLKLHRCVALFLHLIGIYSYKNEEETPSFFYLLDNSSISDFLQQDEHFRLADKVEQ